MKDYQSKFLLQMHSFHKVKFWKLVPELSPSEHMLICALCRCESGKCGEFSDDIDIDISSLKGIKVSELSKAINTTMPGVSRMLASLEEKQIIERKIDPSDRRNTLVFITEEGYMKIQGYKKRINAYFDAVFERFGEERVSEVISLISELADIAQEELDNELNANSYNHRENNSSTSENSCEEGDDR